jgi:hypothetical protein
MAGDFVDVSNLGNVDKLIDQALTVHLGQDTALVVVPATEVSSGKSYAALIGSMRMDFFKKIIKTMYTIIIMKKYPTTITLCTYYIQWSESNIRFLCLLCLLYWKGLHNTDLYLYSTGPSNHVVFHATFFNQRWALRHFSN